MSDINCAHQFKDGNFKGSARRIFTDDSDDVPIGNSLSYYESGNSKRTGIFSFAEFFDDEGGVIEKYKTGLQIYKCSNDLEVNSLSLNKLTSLVVKN